MSDPFAKWRARRAERPVQPAAPPEAKAVVYETPYVNRGWAVLLLFGWAPFMIALVLLMALNERAIKETIPYATGAMTLGFLVLMGSLVAVPMLAASRRSWTLTSAGLAISERPLIPLMGPRRHAVLPLGEVAAARMGEALNGMPIFEIEAKGGARYRIAPRHVGRGRNVRLDFSGFEDFVDAIGDAIEAAGHALPPEQTLRTAASGLTGVVVLGIATAFFAALCLFGLWALVGGEPVGMQALAFGVPLTLLFTGLLRSRWAKWRSGVA
ncbi:MAG: hypothetical protein QM698_02950 [Micropepsaceae bacterium]